jgi:glycosyltransferase involved in cell wall biosynthesis
VQPFPGAAGQQIRVRNKILAFRRHFAVDFLTMARRDQVTETRRRLEPFVERAFVLPSVTQRHLPARMWHKALEGLYTLRTGLRGSNYRIGQVELSPDRVRGGCPVKDYDLVVYEYWHATDSLEVFQAHGIPCVLDMHDVLWQSYDRQLKNHRLPWMRAFRRQLVQAYKRREEAAWSRYDALIAISQGEAEYAKIVVPDKPIFVAPMGTDLDQWHYCWSPAEPPRLAFYGSYGNERNREGVFWCVERIMPLIWEQRPDVEFWIVGASPPPEIRALEGHERIHVTGFVEDVGEVLATMTAVLCPWRGTYGFRSRLIEVMALGVPVVATPDAVYGMGVEIGRGLFLSDDDNGLASRALALLGRPDWAKQQSLQARQQMEGTFGFEATYGQLAGKICGFCLSQTEWYCGA